MGKDMLVLLHKNHLKDGEMVEDIKVLLLFIEPSINTDGKI